MSTIHINAVIWSIEQAHQLHRKPHDVCFQRLWHSMQCRHLIPAYASQSFLYARPFAHKFCQFCTISPTYFDAAHIDKHTHTICLCALRLAYSFFFSFISRQKYPNQSKIIMSPTHDFSHSLTTWVVSNNSSHSTQHTHTKWQTPIAATSTTPTIIINNGNSSSETVKTLSSSQMMTIKWISWKRASEKEIERESNWTES